MLLLLFSVSFMDVWVMEIWTDEFFKKQIYYLVRSTCTNEYSSVIEKQMEKNIFIRNLANESNNIMISRYPQLVLKFWKLPQIAILFFGKTFLS